MKRMIFNFPFRSHEPEILDDFDLQENDLATNLRELEKVNIFLGGYNIVKKGVAQIIERRNLGRKKIRIADVGCGGGDSLRVLSHWGKKKNLTLDLVGVDANPAAIQYATDRAHTHPDIRFEQLDILSPEFETLNADILMFNLFLHHFTEPQIIEFLKTCKTNGSAILINDLQRSKVAYQAFRLVSRVLRFSYISRHDGKLSVKKSFIKEDWRRMMKKAGIDDYRIRWHWAFRYSLLVY